ARNVINILSSDVVVACRGSGGTLSEIALALRCERPLVLLDFQPGEDFLQAAGQNPRYSHAANAAEAAEQIAGFLKELGRG
ncbi:MAG: DNA-binding protein, partial [Proteobacteria bacterium]